MKILAITGIRSEYDILYPVINELRNNHDLSVVISGAHLSNQFGNTYKSIVNDGFAISDKIDTLFTTDRLTQRSKSVGILIYSLAQTVEREKPDVLIVVGDREESIATAIVGNYSNTIVIHLGGGDPVYGNADDPVRFSVSKLSHIHCCFTKEYEKNLLKIGEEKFRVFNTGNPSFANIDSVNNIPFEQLKKDIGIEKLSKKYILLIKHPISSELKESKKQMQVTIESCISFCEANNFQLISISPNSDPGSFGMKEVFNEFKKK